MPKVKKRSAASPLCSTPHCRNKKSKGRHNCHKCRSRAWRENSPIVASFHNLKHRAKERGKEFLITLEQFKEWCEKTGYHLLKGKSAEGMSVDRVKEEGPYSIENIEMKPLGANSKKYHDYWRTHNKGNPDFTPSISPAEAEPW